MVDKFLKGRRALPHPTTAKHLETLHKICEDNTLIKTAGDRIKPLLHPSIPKVTDSDIKELMSKYKKSNLHTYSNNTTCPAMLKLRKENRQIQKALVKEVVKENKQTKRDTKLLETEQVLNHY